MMHLKQQNRILGQFMQTRDDYSMESIGNQQQSNQTIDNILASTTDTNTMQQSFGILSKFMQERNNYLRRSLENLQQSSKKVDKSLASTSKPETIQKISGILGKKKVTTPRNLVDSNGITKLKTF